MEPNIHAVIVDDEQHAIDSFQTLAAIACPSIRIQAAYTDPNDFLAALEHKPAIDILFLDVEMVPYSGFKLLQLLQERYSELPFDVIFLTAYDQYAIQAFGYNALDYLLKPLIIADLQRAIQKWQQKSIKQLHPVQWENLKTYLGRADHKPDRMAIPTLEGYAILLFKDIVRCEADRNYTHIIDQHDQRHVVCRTLKEVEQLLVPQGFLRVHHSHMINPFYVAKILKESGGTLEMTDHKKITITKNREATLEHLFSLIKKL